MNKKELEQKVKDIRETLNLAEKGYSTCPKCKTPTKPKHCHYINGLIIDPLTDSGVREIRIYQCACGHTWEKRI
jgi:hypothetical protein